MPSRTLQLHKIDDASLLVGIAYPVAALCAVAWGMQPSQLLWVCPLAVFLVAASIADLRTFTIPDVATSGVVLLGLGRLLTLSSLPEVAFVVGSGIVLMALFWIVGEVLFRRLGQEGLGIGDAKLIGACTLWTGPMSIWFVLFLGAVGGIIYGLLQRRRSGDGHIPFGPFLAFALYLVVLAGTAP
jgi:prepilin signal peptidase PulO-like enzyme (type II secretory pathway)